MSQVYMPRVLIADDHALVAEALTKFLSPHCAVVATVHDGRTLVQLVERLQPDVVLVDVGMPLLNGLDATRRIKRVLPEVKVICLTVSEDSGIVAEAFRCGASGYLLKTSGLSELLEAIRCVMHGRLYISRSLKGLASLLVAELESPHSTRCDLTDRQVEVLQLLAEGHSMKEAGAVLNLTTRTIAFHKYRIMNTLNLHNDAEVIQYAMREHIVFS